MKTVVHLYRHIMAGSLALAVLGFMSGPGTAWAQQKGAEKLMKVQTVEDLQKIEAGDTIIMTCPKCKDTYASVVEKTYKAVKPEEAKTLQIHLCASCDTKIVTKGHGKQAKDVLVHTCKACGSEDVNCCVMKKGSGPTQGMTEKK